MGLWRDDWDEEEEVEEEGDCIFRFAEVSSSGSAGSFSVEVVSSRGDQELLSGGQVTGVFSAGGVQVSRETP